MPPKYPHTPPYQVSYRYDCNFRRYTDSLIDAIETANAKHPLALITVHAGPMFVGVYAWQVKDQPVEQVFAAFDAEVESQIENLRRIGRWPPPNRW